MKKTTLSILPAMLLLAALLLSACGPSNLTVTDAWARPGQKGTTSAVYLTITNPTAEDDSLVSIQSDIANDIRPHSTITKDDGTTTMQEVRILGIKAKGGVTFKPGGLHVMLTGLSKDLKPGDTFPLTFIFRKAGAVPVTVTVKEQ
jgi:copper(I)-binding protein